MSEQLLDWPAIRKSARWLEQGELVAFPTETVYGLGADAENPAAVAKIYAAKGRPANHPVIVHLAPEAEISYWTPEITGEARKLIDAFWPGPLTIIFKRALHIPGAVSGGQNSIGLRCPSHPIAQALLRTFKEGKGGLAAPSANKFGHVSPTTAQHVRDEFNDGQDDAVRCILDGGQSEVGIESTIIDMSRGHAVMLRPGDISGTDIANVLGRMPSMPDDAAPRASGLLESHYAPRSPLALVDSEQIGYVLDQLSKHGRRVALIRHGSNCNVLTSANITLPPMPSVYAFGLYAALRAMDAAQADVIVVEAPPGDDDWDGVNDRLRRAAHDSAGVLNKLLQA